MIYDLNFKKYRTHDIICMLVNLVIFNKSICECNDKCAYL